MRTSAWHSTSAAITVAAFLGSITAFTQITLRKPRSGNRITRDSTAIMATITGEAAAFWNKDFEAWSKHWVHAPYVRVMGWWATGGVTVREGWEKVGGEVKQMMQDNPQPNPTATRVRRENINLQVRGNVAWLTFDQYGLETGDKAMDMPGLSQETRVLEKQDGKWRIVYVGWLLQGSNK